MSMSRILVVDDTPTIRRLASAALSNAGYSVAVADSALAGIHEARALQPNLVVLDWAMQGTDGLTFLNKLAAHTEGRDVPVLLLCKKGDKLPQQNLTALGVVDTLLKPFSQDALVTAVQRCLSLHPVANRDETVRMPTPNYARRPSAASAAAAMISPPLGRDFSVLSLGEMPAPFDAMPAPFLDDNSESGPTRISPPPNTSMMGQGTSQPHKKTTGITTTGSVGQNGQGATPSAISGAAIGATPFASLLSEDEKTIVNTRAPRHGVPLSPASPSSAFSTAAAIPATRRVAPVAIRSLASDHSQDSYDDKPTLDAHVPHLPQVSSNRSTTTESAVRATAAQSNTNAAAPYRDWAQDLAQEMQRHLERVLLQHAAHTQVNTTEITTAVMRHLDPLLQHAAAQHTAQLLRDDKNKVAPHIDPQFRQKNDAILLPSLSGSLRDIPLPEILQLLKFQSQTGLIAVWLREGNIEVTLENGFVTAVHMSPANPLLRLGRYFIAARDLSEQQIDVLLQQHAGLWQYQQQSRQRAVTIGQFLLDKKVISPEQLRRALAEQAQDITYILLRATEGFFVLYVGESALARQRPTLRMEPGLPIDGLLFEALRRIDEMAVVHKMIPTEDTLLTRTDVPPPRNEKWSTTENELLSLFQTRRSLTPMDAVREGKLRLFDAWKALHRLMTLRLLERTDAQGRAAPAFTSLTSIEDRSDEESTQVNLSSRGSMAQQTALADAGFDESSWTLEFDLISNPSGPL